MDESKDIFDHRNWNVITAWFCYDLSSATNIDSLAFSLGSGTTGPTSFDAFITDVPYATVAADESSYTPVFSMADTKLRGGTLVTFNTPKEGRYVIFKVVSGLSGYSTQQAVQISELAASGKLPAGAHTSAAITAENKIAVADNLLTKATYSSNVTPSGGTVDDLIDGKYGYVDGDAVVFDSRSWNQDFYGWFCYDLGVQCNINSVAFSVGSGTVGVQSIDVFITDVPYGTVQASESSYKSLVNVSDTKVRGGTLATFAEPQKGRYVIFKVKGGLSGYQTQMGLFITEFAATGTVPDDAHTTTAVNKGFTVAENLLATAVYSSNVTPGAGTAADLVDGKCAWADGDAVIFDVRSWNNIVAWFCYDLGAEAEIDKVFFNVGSGNQGMTGVAVYITNDAPATVQANEGDYTSNVSVVADKIRGGTLAEFLKPQKGRYVMFKVNSGLSGYSTQQAIFVSELGATGTIPYAETASHALGAQIRGEDVTDQTASTDLRFAFKMDIPGVEEGEIDGTWDASAKIGEKQCSVLEMGLLVVKTSNSEDLYGDMVAESSNGNVVKMNANKIYEITSDDITVTGVVTNIGNADFGTEISMRAYMVCEIEGVPTPVYSDIITRCVNDLLGDA